MRAACACLLLLSTACGRIGFDRQAPSAADDAGLQPDGAAADGGFDAGVDAGSDAATGSDGGPDGGSDAGAGACSGASSGPTVLSPIDTSSLQSTRLIFLGMCDSIEGNCDLEIRAYRLDVCALSVSQAIDVHNDTVVGVPEIDPGVPLVPDVLARTEPGADGGLRNAIDALFGRPFVQGEQSTSDGAFRFSEVSSLLDDEGLVFLVLDFQRDS